MNASVSPPPGSVSESADRNAANELRPLPGRHYFTRRLFISAAIILVLSIAGSGLWLAQQIEDSAVKRAAAIAGAYTESILARELDGAPLTEPLPGPLAERLDQLFVSGPLARKVVRFKLWAADGTILYSSDPSQQGLRHPVRGLLGEAFGGTLVARMTPLDQADNAAERAHWPRLMEVYVPLGGDKERPAALVAEFYHGTANLDREIRRAQQRSWTAILVATLVIGFLLHRLFLRADETIGDQARDLHRQLARFRAALADNERIRAELHRAGDRTTALNESLLHRIAADLHDGPAQQIAFALMRFDDACCEHCPGRPSSTPETVRKALQEALTELRTIAAGLGMPNIEGLDLDAIVRRAVHDSERRFGLQAHIEIGALPRTAGIALKITLYRFIQECLNNVRRHAGPAQATVLAQYRDGSLQVRVSDDGRGFAADSGTGHGRLGLAFLEERVRLAGGQFALHSAPGAGCTVEARFPLQDRNKA